MSSITVVVPTMWRYHPFVSFLQNMLHHRSVTSVVLINNQTDQTPCHRILQHSKLKILDFGQNIFVNPAWNTGVSQSQTDIVCLVNDDITFDLRLFDRVVDWFKPCHGVLGLGSGEIDGDIHFVPRINQSIFGFGQLMFVHASTWVDIPSDLLVYFGDNWIFDLNQHKWGCNHLICNLLHHTPHAQTSHEQVHRLEEERLLYQDHLKKLGIDPIHG
jgi:hypothetical protein